MYAPHREVAMHLGDDQLVARCCAGDLDAFGQVYARYERQVYRYAYRLLGNREEADDVKQETFLRAYRAIPGFRNDSSLLTWLMRICGNLCRDRLKSSQNRREVLYDPQATPESPHGNPAHTDPFAVIERAETTAIIRRALAGMPEKYREAVLLRDVENLSYEEIAGILGCSRPMVKLRLFRARRMLKERVEALSQARE
jgi:RNA polymerase sigma-70 factor (ECF subfamily)